MRSGWLLLLALTAACPNTCNQTRPEDCTAEADEDGDGAANCSDSDCADHTACRTNPTRCGDGVADQGEECDGTDLVGQRCASLGFDTGTLTCLADCTLDTSDCRHIQCGDGRRDGNEGCDDGNREGGDGCSTQCRVEYCGDGLVNNHDTEECDDGNTFNGDGCTAQCVREEPVGCGTGVIDVGLGEVCDDGNTVAGDGCRADCRGEEECGDGLLDEVTGEACDDGNTADLDGCTGACVRERCGDGVVNNAGQEQCDDGNTTNDDGCDSTCQREGCGNAVLEEGEVCDDGNLEAGDGCRADCRGEEECGDGLLDEATGEACDDDNTVSGDGCTAACVVERCGDGVVNNAGLEDCDDGNNDGTDACPADCVFPCGHGSGATGAVLHAETGHCYLGFSSALGWFAAQGDCVDRGGNLVSVEDAEENTRVRSVLTGALWLGATDQIQEGTLGWITGEPVVFTDFTSGQPDNVGNADCVQMLPDSAQWDDSTCATALPYVCELATPVCGNGAFEEGEQCDDGNTDPGDGCDATCQPET
ncbi:MAG: DUF4215 domain-containing protein [Myxococcota bacterium]